MDYNGRLVGFFLIVRLDLFFMRFEGLGEFDRRFSLFRVRRELSRFLMGLDVG